MANVTSIGTRWTGPNSDLDFFGFAPKGPEVSVDAVLRRIGTLAGLGTQADFLVGYYSGATSTSTSAAVSSIVELLSMVPVSSTPRDVISDIKGRSGLTWDQISRALGVSKRAVLLWASGGQVSAPNLDNLVDLRKMITDLSGATVADTRVRLLTSEEGEPSPLTCWVAGRVARTSRVNAPVLSPTELMG